MNRLIGVIIVLTLFTACSNTVLFVPYQKAIHQETGYIIFWGQYSYFAPAKVDTSKLYYIEDLFRDRKIDLYYFDPGHCDFAWRLINCCGECFTISKDYRLSIDSSNIRRCDTTIISNKGFMVPVTLSYYFRKGYGEAEFSEVYDGGIQDTIYYYNEKKMQFDIKY